MPATPTYVPTISSKTPVSDFFKALGATWDLFEHVSGLLPEYLTRDQQEEFQTHLSAQVGGLAEEGALKRHKSPQHPRPFPQRLPKPYTVWGVLKLRGGEHVTSRGWWLLDTVFGTTTYFWRQLLNNTGWALYPYTGPIGTNLGYFEPRSEDDLSSMALSAKKNAIQTYSRIVGARYTGGPIRTVAGPLIRQVWPTGGSVLEGLKHSLRADPEGFKERGLEEGVSTNTVKVLEGFTTHRNLPLDVNAATKGGVLSSTKPNFAGTLSAWALTQHPPTRRLLPSAAGTNGRARYRVRTGNLMRTEQMMPVWPVGLLTELATTAPVLPTPEPDGGYAYTTQTEPEYFEVLPAGIRLNYLPVVVTVDLLRRAVSAEPDVLVQNLQTLGLVDEGETTEEGLGEVLGMVAFLLASYPDELEVGVVNLDRRFISLEELGSVLTGNADILDDVQALDDLALIPESTSWLINPPYTSAPVGKVCSSYRRLVNRFVEVSEGL